MLEDALEALRRGRLVMVFDGEDREGEVDFVMRADAATPEVVRWLRLNAGGLLCFTTTEEVGRGLGLEFLSEYFAKRGFSTTPRYGDEPAFMGYVNHKKTATGVRDADKALTVRELAKVVELALKDVEQARRAFADNFYAPGHVPILGARLGRRWGHTELSVLLAKAAGVPPALIIIEALGSSTEAMPLAEAKELAARWGIPLITGEEIKAALAP